MQDEQLTIDFGDPELNDPDYEKKLDAGGEDGASTEPTTDGETQQGGENGAEPQVQADQPTGNQAGEGGATDSTGQQQPAGNQQPAPTGLKPDKEGNLVDAQGNVVATAGSARRAFERVQAQDRVIKDMEGTTSKLRQDLAQAQALNDAPQKLGLSPDDAQMGLQAIASFKKDPVSTARWMLQETMRLGYDLKQIIGANAQGQMDGGSLDLAAVKSMIGEAIGPMVADRNAQTAQTQAQTDAAREYDRFIANHDNASIHEDSIASLLRRDPQLTPEVAYWQLREYTAKNGLDFASPLGPQVQALKQGDRAPNGNATPQAQTAQQQPMPNGGAPTMDMQQGSTMADPDDAWDNIVNQSLREAGMMQ